MKSTNDIDNTMILSTNDNTIVKKQVVYDHSIKVDPQDILSNETPELKKQYSYSSLEYKVKELEEDREFISLKT